MENRLVGSMRTRKLLLLSAVIIAILVSSTLFVAIPTIPSASAQQKVPGANWEYSNYDSYATSFNPQTQITKGNIQSLELKWTYPIPPFAVAGKALDVGAGLFGAPIAEGSITPPLVIDGIVYFTTNYFRVTALDASSGKLIWTYQVTANLTEAKKSMPIGGAQGHLHAIYYYNGWIVFPGLVCDVIAIDALTGKLAWTIEKACANIPGNTGLYTGGFQSYPPVLYKRGNILIYVPGVVDGFTGRGFVAGYDMNAVLAAKSYSGPPKWLAFTVPPAGKLGTPERNAWGQYLVDNCKRIWIQGVSSCDIPQDLLRNDWGDMDCLQRHPGIPLCVTKSGTGTVWGQMSVDEETGIVYMATSQPTVDWNATYRPGPSLFSVSILAINAATGQLVWAHQSITHDLWDLDCSWNTVLGKIGNRKVIFKTCKTGFTHAFDAASGELIWYFKHPNQRDSDYKPFWLGSKLSERGTGKADNSIIGAWDPRRRETLTLPWENYPSKEPLWETGFAASTDLAFDGKTIYTRVVNTWSYIAISTADVGGGRTTLPTPSSRPANATIFALDSETGKLKWSAFFEGPKRTGQVVSGGVVYFSHSDGNLYALDADTGKLVWQKFFGIALSIPPTIGATADGKMRLFQLTGAPGALLVFGLPDKLPEPQIITKEVVKEVIKEVPKEVIKEVPKEVTKTVTVETVSPISYAAIGVSIVILVVAGVLFSRRKKA